MGKIKAVKLKKSEIVLLVVTVLVILFAGFLYFVEPFMKRYSGVNESNQVLSSKIMKDLKYLRRKKGQISCLSEFLKRHSLSSDKKNAINIVIKDIGAFAKDAGLKLSEIKPAYTDEKDSFLKVGVQLQVTGQLKQALSFIQKIENSDMLFVIEKAVLNSTKNGINLQMTVYRIYYAG